VVEDTSCGLSLDERSGVGKSH